VSIRDCSDERLTSADLAFQRSRRERPSCRRHNLQKGSAEALQRDLGMTASPTSAVISGDYSRRVR
jgi:hypothetical protein